jgi:hypothetical protein
MSKVEITTKLLAIQSELHAPKSQRNNFGNYNYRSCEDILEAAKPLLKKHGLLLTVSDQIKVFDGVKENANIMDNKNQTETNVEITGRYYIEATATVTDGENSISSTAQARESYNKKGMDAAQITGASSSYARKYALNGLFLIDDNKDADHG